MLISRNVYDPGMAHFPGNKLARTIGFYGHTPKFWSCKDYDFDAYWKMHSTDHTIILPDGGEVTVPAMITDADQISQMQERADQARRAHADCKRKHMSYVGYLVFVGPKRRYTFWYMGNPYRPGKVFERGNSGTIIFRGRVVNKQESLIQSL